MFGKSFLLGCLTVSQLALSTSWARALEDPPHHAELDKRVNGYGMPILDCPQLFFKEIEASVPRNFPKNSFFSPNIVTGFDKLLDQWYYNPNSVVFGKWRGRNYDLQIQWSPREGMEINQKEVQRAILRTIRKANNGGRRLWMSFQAKVAYSKDLTSSSWENQSEFGDERRIPSGLVSQTMGEIVVSIVPDDL